MQKNCFLNVSLVERHVSSLLEDAQIKREFLSSPRAQDWGLVEIKLGDLRVGDHVQGAHPPYHHHQSEC